MQETLIEHIETLIPNILSNSRNLILIFASIEELRLFVLNYNRELFKGKIVLEFTNFRSDYDKILDKLEELSNDNFIILTTKEGSRGVDYKGPSPAHVIICYEPSSYADCI